MNAYENALASLLDEIAAEHFPEDELPDLMLSYSVALTKSLPEDVVQRDVHSPY